MPQHTDVGQESAIYLTKKYVTARAKNLEELIKRAELISKCRHKNKDI